VIYGHTGTIHGTEKLDIQLDRKGNVVAVWFRCMLLPFRVSEHRKTQAEGKELLATDLRGILAVEIDDFEPEEPYTVRKNTRPDAFGGYPYLVVERATGIVRAMVFSEKLAAEFAYQLNTTDHIEVEIPL